jgi:putative FmdB family regulatory protein
MPLYDYKCSKCEHIFEKFKSISNMEQPCSEPCPSCNELNTVQKMVNGVGLVQWEKNLRPDDTFTDLLKQVKKNNKHSTIDEKFYK